MEEKNSQNNSDFMKETIKQRPLNRKKLVRRTLITAAMAVIFGTIACLTFLLLEPVISNRLYPQEEPETVVFVEEEEDEILPEDMIVDESQMYPEPTPVPVEDEQIAQQIDEVISEMEFQLDAEDYVSLIGGVSQIAKNVQSSLVNVVGVTSDVDWFNNEYENEGVVSGAVIADNGRELLIVANVNSIEDAELLKVAFANSKEYEAQIKRKDNNTGLAVLAIDKSIMDEATITMATPVSLGSSAASTLIGSPVIALGRPMGTEGSVSYGSITSMGTGIRLPDSSYKLLATDIYGSSSASGVLVNLKGQVIGIIDMSYNFEDMKNLISAIGITELKSVVQHLSNDEDIAFLGVHGADVTREANEELGVPLGAYITAIDMDSPAMEAGIQSGDVIISAEDQEITHYQELINILLQKKPEETLGLEIMRQGPEGYTAMEVMVTLEIME